MGSTYRFVAAPSEPCEVVAWFRELDEPPVEVAAAHGAVFHFETLGPLVYRADGSIESKASPVINVLVPEVRRGALWTVGEVHFLATPLRQLFPKLHKVSVAFSKWLATHECVYSNKRESNPFGYYLEGSVTHYDAPVFACTSGSSALARGQYFVGADDNEFVLERVCRTLRLRGVECVEA